MAIHVWTKVIALTQTLMDGAEQVASAHRWNDDTRGGYYDIKLDDLYYYLKRQACSDWFEQISSIWLLDEV
jgi:hypothetical protein